MAKAVIVISQGGKNQTYNIDLTIDAQFNSEKYARLRMLEYNRLFTEGFNAALSFFNADNPISNDAFIVVSFDGMPTVERKENAD